jgi:phosphoglycolate phosphatase-like HAD superfamily hydrolase
MFAGFVFDVEGTLIDSVQQNLRSLQEALEKSGYRIPIQTLHLYSGLDGDQLLRLAIPEASDDERRAILQEQCAIYERDYLPSVKAFDGVRDVFKVLSRHGGRVALATDCKGLAFRRYMSLLNADEFIAATACGDDVEHGKPDPRLVGMALRKLSVLGSQAVMVGDTPYDAEAGIDAGTKVAGVLTGGFTQKVLDQAGCFAVGRDLQALLPSLLFGEGGPEPRQTDWLRSA